MLFNFHVTKKAIVSQKLTVLLTSTAGGGNTLGFFWREIKGKKKKEKEKERKEMSNADVDTSESAAMAAEEYRVWKKNTPYLYDFVLSHALEWPSLTVQWVPPAAAATTTSHRLLLGTHTAHPSPNFLILADASFPPHLPSSPSSAAPPPPLPSVSIARQAPHHGEVNRARHMPQRPNIVATKTCGTEVHVFDMGKEDEICGPDVVLKGHQTEGYGVDWSPMKEGWLLSGSYDSKICLWDVGTPESGKVMDAQHVFEAHTAAVEDVSWHFGNENLFGSVGDDHMLMIWDLRTSKPQHSITAHADEVNSLAFNQFNEWILATGSADSTANLFDLRKLTTSLHTFSSHTGAVLQVEWSPDYESVLASSADDRRVMIWDLYGIGNEQDVEDVDDGPPELLFSHGGHTANISEFSWSPTEPWVIASVAEDNILHIWQVAESIYRDEFSLDSEGDIYAAT